MHVAFIIPTCNRHADLARTLEHLGTLDRGSHGPCEVVIIDNASSTPVDAPTRLANGWRVSLIRQDENLAAAARNVGATNTDAAWLCMLDDDSNPTGPGLFDAAQDAPADVAAIGARIHLAGGGHDRGGLPEVITGCGALVRRDVFVALGGYDPDFEYYAEEYDLCARIIAHGSRVIHDARFDVMHHKVETGRDLDRILGLLVRNNGWVIKRYTPEHLQDEALTRMTTRYRNIANKENAVDGFERGLAQLIDTVDEQSVQPLSESQYRRFSGRAAVEASLPNAVREHAVTRVAIVEADKHVEIVRSVLEACPGVAVVTETADADGLVIGTLAPGPIMDARASWADDSRPVIPSWPVFDREGPAAVEPSI